jgi:cytochrome c peroxidase
MIACMAADGSWLTQVPQADRQRTNPYAGQADAARSRIFCAVDQGLPTTIGQVKTPTLRDLADSTPYLHNGSKLTLDDVVHFYVQNSQLAHQGLLRNSPPEFQGMSLTDADIANLVAFLKALTEDYDDA